MILRHKAAVSARSFATFSLLCQMNGSDEECLEASGALEQKRVASPD